MATRALRVGLLGTGVAAWRLYKPAFATLGDRLELVACANRTRSKAMKYAKAAGFARVADSPESLFNATDIDAVFISLPIDVQPSFVLEALRAGKAVLSEKPIAASVTEAKALISRTRALPAPWMVGENYAFMSHVRKLENLLASGKLGQIRAVEVRQINWMDRRNPYFNTAWRQSPKHLGGFVLDAGVHLAHVVNRCFGASRVIGARQASFCPDLPPMDTATALLRFESGALGTWLSCFTARDQGSPMLKVLGETGTAALYHERLEITSHRGKVSQFPALGDSFALQFSHFADVVLRGKPMDISPQMALADLRLISAVCGDGN